MSTPEQPMRVSICICTFRRAHIVETLASIARLRLPGHVNVEIIVADNDGEPSARARVDTFAQTIEWPLHYIHAPASNISIARNACLDQADGDYLAFVDDDETVTEDWLAELLGAAKACGFEAVLGPVHAVYGTDAPDWMRQSDFHSTYPVFVKDEIRTGYTCNVLLDRASPLVKPLRFDPRLGRSGGEDTDFFTRLHRSGGRIGYAPKAVVLEQVPHGRTSFSWLARRRFRMGQTHGGLLRTGGGNRLAGMGLAGAKLLACGVLTLAALGSAAGRRKNALRGILHAGAISGLSGRRSGALYGETGKTDEE